MCGKRHPQGKEVSEFSSYLESKLCCTLHTTDLINGKLVFGNTDLELCFEYLEATC